MTDLLDLAPCAFISFADDGLIQMVNQTLLRLLGYQRSDLVGHHLDRIFSPGARIFYQTHLFPLLKMCGEAEEIYISLRTASGEEVPVLVNGRRNERDGCELYDCVLIRIRERARFEEEILKARNAAQKANQAKDDFLAALSHELRNPLNPILMLATAMEMDPALPEDARRQAGIIRRNAELETRLIDDLLDLTRVAHGKIKLVESTVDLHLLLAETEEIVRSDRQSKRVPVHFSKEAQEHHVRGDEARLQQVFWNLVKNAIKFTPPEGEVRVRTNNFTPGRVSVRIMDTGIGIEPAALPRIFDAFEQGTVSTQQFGGLGLGLAIAHALVKMHGGSLRAESPGRDQGATFTVEFATCPAPAAPDRLIPPKSSAKRPLRLLLVEDHDATREVLTRILQRAGHQIHAAATGGEALQIADSAGPFDVLISDLGLPDLSGFELMRAIRSRHDLPGIALSGYGMDEDVRKAMEAGFSAHLVKPISVDHLRIHLDELMAAKSR